jgi:hypothetical protein
MAVLKCYQKKKTHHISEILGLISPCEYREASSTVEMSCYWLLESGGGPPRQWNC